VATVIEKFVELLPSWGASLAYGEKTTVDGHELVPVAIVALGFGGGEGSGGPPGSSTAPADRSEGSGGGAGGFALPIGAYIGGPDGVAFRPNAIALIATVVPLVSTVGCALAIILRAARGRTAR
jgi:uncharacterized spore protein YtfJ